MLLQRVERDIEAMSDDSRGLSRTRRNALAPLIERHATQEGITETDCPGLILGRSNGSIPRFPLVYSPSICVVAQGQKRVFQSGEDFIVYDPLHYLVVTLPMPLEAEIHVDREGRPFLGLALEIDIATVGKLLLDMADVTPQSDLEQPQTIFSSPLSKGLLGGLKRLLRSLDDPMDRRILGPSAIREVLYHVLKGEQGASLRSLALRDNNSSRVAQIIRYLQDNFHRPLDVSAIARQAGMGESTLHHSFKKLVGQSPMQYLKKTRLHQARLMMVSNGMNAGEAGFRVGYGSASQFSREFKRLFGVPPSRAAETL